MKNSEISGKRPLKLFVVGTSNGDPSEWSEWGNRAYVLAESLDQALSMVDFSNCAAEIDASEPVIIGYSIPKENL